MAIFSTYRGSLGQRYSEVLAGLPRSWQALPNHINGMIRFSLSSLHSLILSSVSPPYQDFEPICELTLD